MIKKASILHKILMLLIMVLLLFVSLAFIVFSILFAGFESTSLLEGKEFLSLYLLKIILLVLTLVGFKQEKKWTVLASISLFLVYFSMHINMLLKIDSYSSFLAGNIAPAITFATMIYVLWNRKIFKN